MLSAFTARPIVELKPRDKSKIESILAYGDRLLVGLNTGVLRVYRINEPTNDPSEPSTSLQTDDGPSSPPDRPPSQSKPKIAELLREQEKFSRYKIEQL